MTAHIVPTHPDTLSRCSIDWGDGLPPQDTIISAAMALANFALLRAPRDMHRLVLRDSMPGMQADASCLHSEAVGVSHMAQAFRAARWAGRPTPRISDELFSMRRYGTAPLTPPDTATLAGLYCAGGALKTTPQEHAELKDRFDLLFELAHRAPSICPVKEAALASKGYSASELVGVKFAQHVLHLAGLYRAALESPRPNHMLVLDPEEHDVQQLRKDARDAEDLARDALRVISDGVAYGFRRSHGD